MSGLNVAYWQMAFDKSLPNIESRIHKKLDQLEKFHSISMENLSDWQHKQMKDLEEETKETIGFLEIIKKKLESYLIESAEIADLLLQQSVENQQLRQEIEEQNKVKNVMLDIFSNKLNIKSYE